jgi:hypothetical protein
MSFSEFYDSITALTNINLNDYVNFTATSPIGINDVLPQSFTDNIPYLNLENDDLLTFNRPSTFTDNITIVGNIYNTTLSSRLTSITESLSNKSNKITLGGTFNFVFGQPEPRLVYSVLEDGTSYPIIDTADIVWSKIDNNINLNISDTFKNNLDNTYAKISEVADITQAIEIFLKNLMRGVRIKL